MNDRIEKRVELKAPISRVWRAVTDHREFGEWFRVKLDGPFVPGQGSRGQITYPATSMSNGRRSCRKWSLNGCFPSPGLILSPWKRLSTHRVTIQKTQPRLSR